MKTIEELIDELLYDIEDVLIDAQGYEAQGCEDSDWSDDRMYYSGKYSGIALCLNRVREFKAQVEAMSNTTTKGKKK